MHEINSRRVDPSIFGFHGQKQHRPLRPRINTGLARAKSPTNNENDTLSDLTSVVLNDRLPTVKRRTFSTSIAGRFNMNDQSLELDVPSSPSPRVRTPTIPHEAKGPMAGGVKCWKCANGGHGHAGDHDYTPRRSISRNSVTPVPKEANNRESTYLDWSDRAGELQHSPRLSAVSRNESISRKRPDSVHENRSPSVLGDDPVEPSVPMRAEIAFGKRVYKPITDPVELEAYYAKQRRSMIVPSPGGRSLSNRRSLIVEDKRNGRSVDEMNGEKTLGAPASVERKGRDRRQSLGVNFHK